MDPAIDTTARAEIQTEVVVKNIANNMPYRPNGNEATAKGVDAASVAGTTTFGWGKFQPKFLQRFCTAKWALFWLCWGGAMQGLVVNGFINVVITTIERRFGLRSRQTGLVASGYDIASFLCLVPVTYFGGRNGASKPRFIAWGIILIGLGALTFALPHFLVGHYRATSSEMVACLDEDVVGNGSFVVSSKLTAAGEDLLNVAVQSTHDGVSTENLTWTVWFFFAAQLLHGAGAAPLFTLGVTYIDENVSTKMSSVYLGIFYTMAIIGPAVGYVVGGQFLRLFTDFLTTDANSLGLTSASNVWIGAWWIGFIFAALLCILLAVPIFGYPRSLPGAQKLQQAKVCEAYNGNSELSKSTARKQEKHRRKAIWQELPRALMSLLKNPTFCFLNLAGASEGLVIAGFTAFLPKLIENQFSISPVWSALLMGLITVPAGGGGTFLGGYLVKRYQLACSGIIKMCLMATIVAMALTTCFLLSCPNLAFAGLTRNYTSSVSELHHRNYTSSIQISTFGHNERDYYRAQLDETCNENCSCSRKDYNPVCGADGLVYFNPCYAGCQDESFVDSIKQYKNCSCVRASELGDHPGGAISTMCATSCQNLPYFIAVCFVLMLFTFLATMPALSATLRCVTDDQRSFGLGIQWIKVRLLGTIPAPLIFGALIDETCILWQETKDDRTGACLVYDNEHMSWYMWLLAFVSKFCSVVFFFGAWWFYIPPKQAVLDGARDKTISHAEHSKTGQQATLTNGHANTE